MSYANEPIPDKINMESIELPDNWQELSDYDLGGLLLGLFFGLQAHDLGIPANQISDEFAERVRQYVLTIESKTAKDAAVEKALHKAVQGDFVTAGHLLREFMETSALNIAAIDEAVTGKRRQRKNAKKPRANRLRKLIREIVAKKPEMTANELLLALKKEVGKGIIEEIDDDEIAFIDENGKGGHIAPITGLRGRLNRAKDFFKNNSSR